MRPMTAKQGELYRWLLARADDDVGPTFEAMREAMGLKSRANVHRLIEVMEERGLVTRVRNRACSVRAVRANRFDGIATADLVAEIKRRGEWHYGG